MLFTETARCKALALTAAVPIAAGAAAGGGAVATYYTGAHHTTPGTYVGVATYGYATPDHNDPVGEFTRIEAAPTMGTASVNFNILGPWRARD